MRTWHRPTPSALLMWALGFVNRWFLLLGLPIVRGIPFVRDLPLVHGYFWVRRLDLPPADRANLREAVNRETVAFLGPNHPEFGTDWMIDKEISSLVAPRMASWADSGIVDSAPRFWGMNNLVANNGGDAAKEYSIEWALQGEGVLLHPEGTVRWTNDHVHPLYPGIAQMAIEAAARTDKPVYIVPLVWKYCYVADVTRRIHREMRILEDGLRLPRESALPVSRRFEALQNNILAMRMRRFGYSEQTASPNFFECQRGFQEYLIDILEQHHRSDASDRADTRIARLARAVRGQLSALKGDTTSAASATRTTLQQHVEMADEAKRLGEFSRDVYGTAMLTQEQLFESLKRTRDRLLRRGWKNVLGNMLPRPFGPRVVHVGVPVAIRVTRVTRSNAKEYESTLLDLTRARMQEKLDEINRRIVSEVRRHAVPNPFVDGPGTVS